MTDRREEILARLTTLLGTVEGVAGAKRNTTEVPEKKRPFIIIYDGDEEARDEAEQGKGRSALKPTIMTMTPEVVVFDADKAVDVGTSLNALRAKVIKAVLSDATLTKLAMGMRYQAISTGFALGRNIEGEGVMVFAFDYALIPQEL